MLRIVYIFLFISLVSSLNLSASERFSPDDSIKFIIESKVHYGFVITHHKNMAHLTAGHFPAFELNIGKQTHGEKVWQDLYKYPVMGVCFWYANLANPKMLGSAYSVYPYLNFHLAQSNSIALNYRFGIGLGYLTKKFDRLDNYKNIAIGSHLNVAINMLYELKLKVRNDFFVSGTVGITHFSNGAFKAPNLGINISTVSIGAAYIFKDNSIAIHPNHISLEKDKRKLEIQTFLSGGMKEIYPAYGDKYGAFSWSTCFLKPLSLKRKICAGLDFFWVFSNIRSLKRKGIEVEHAWEVIRPGIFIGHELEFGKLSFGTQLGYYLYAKDKSDGNIYCRFPLRYQVSNKVFINLALKTHFAKADFIEWGIGYKIK